MFDISCPDLATEWYAHHHDLTTAKLAALWQTTEPLLLALHNVAETGARRRPRDRVSATMLADARRLLRDARKILAREPVVCGLLSLPEAPDWTELYWRLALVRTALRRYHERYTYFDEDGIEHVWATVEQARLERVREERALERRAAGDPDMDDDEDEYADEDHNELSD